MMRLERLRADHADALLAFERENRAYFARSVPDRGDAYFLDFASRHRALLEEQAAGLCHFPVIVGHGGLVGRVNLVDANEGTAELGYRIGERAAGRGTATAAVEAVTRLAVEAYELDVLTATATLDNRASIAVLRRNGFTAVEDLDLDGRLGVRFRRQLVPPESRS